jgi:hypothetical protein
MYNKMLIFKTECLKSEQLTEEENKGLNELTQII